VSSSIPVPNEAIGSNASSASSTSIGPSSATSTSDGSVGCDGVSMAAALGPVRPSARCSAAGDSPVVVAAAVAGTAPRLDPLRFHAFLKRSNARPRPPRRPSVPVPSCLLGRPAELSPAIVIAGTSDSEAKLTRQKEECGGGVKEAEVRGPSNSSSRCRGPFRRCVPVRCTLAN